MKLVVHRFIKGEMSLLGCLLLCTVCLLPCAPLRAQEADAVAVGSIGFAEGHEGITKESATNPEGTTNVTESSAANPGGTMVYAVGSLPTPSLLPEKKKKHGVVSRFEHFVKHFIDFNDYDTTYITPNKYNFAMMLANNSTYEKYRLSSTGSNPQSLGFAPNPSYKLGLYFGWRWIFIGWTMDASEVFGGHNKKNEKKKEFNLNLYSSKLGADFYYWTMGHDYKLKTISGFTQPETSSTTEDSNSSAEEASMMRVSLKPPTIFDSDDGEKLKTSIDFSGINAIVKGFNLYYIFNNKHFSYPAAFSQSTNQRKSAGTFLTGFSFSSHEMTFDYEQLPEWILTQLEDEMKVNKMKYKDYSLHFGYAYNWVFLRNCLATISLAPAVAYKSSHLESNTSNNFDQRHRSLNVDFVTRAAIVYNNAKYFTGLSWVGHSYEYSRRDFSLNNSYGTLQFYMGFNFGKKK